MLHAGAQKALKPLCECFRQVFLYLSLVRGRLSERFNTHGPLTIYTIFNVNRINAKHFVVISILKKQGHEQRYSRGPPHKTPCDPIGTTGPGPRLRNPVLDNALAFNQFE